MGCQKADCLIVGEEPVKAGGAKWGEQIAFPGAEAAEARETENRWDRK